MPLIKSKSKAAVGKNIKTELAAGRPRKTAIAIALSTQRAAAGRKGGVHRKLRKIMSGASSRY